MADINQLSAVSSLADGDQLPVYSQSNGDARRTPLSLLATYLQGKLTAAGGPITQYAAPAATGFTVTINPPTNGTSIFLLLTPLAAYAAGTITLPAVALCNDGQELTVHTTQAVTALTVAGNGATAVNGSPTTLAQFGFFKLRFDKVNTSWYRVG